MKTRTRCGFFSDPDTVKKVLENGAVFGTRLAAE
jgi:hypothetical protein